MSNLFESEEFINDVMEWGSEQLREGVRHPDRQAVVEQVQAIIENLVFPYLKTDIYAAPDGITINLRSYGINNGCFTIRWRETKDYHVPLPDLIRHRLESTLCKMAMATFIKPTQAKKE